MLCVSLLIVTLDNTILNVALPTLVRELDASTTRLQWIVDAYALVFTGLMLVPAAADWRCWCASPCGSGPAPIPC